LLAWAARGDLPCRIASGVNLFPLAYMDVERGGWLFAVVNLSADDVERAELEVAALGDGESKVERLDEQGHWSPVAGPVEHRLHVDVGAFSLAAYRCRREA
jgi:hypothetical protein